ncbi:hypothetical protein QTJ16_006543 [Diplocarpon rosae]|uniref:SET domain-containing protein n=1 Tax=Diplocarpon rosae TaxID=946125 RepID=A0AAD9SVJ9_9HELO|nr:hypothetical protein QTJ16_006543 [Diplocarpon rosae]
MDQLLTPLHLTFADGQFTDTSPIRHAAMGLSFVSTAGKDIKKKTKKRKTVQSVFASLYDDRGQAQPIIELSPEIVQRKTIFEVKSTNSERKLEVEIVSLEESENVSPVAAMESLREEFAKINISPEIEAATKPKPGGIQTDWLGTSQFYVDALLELQKEASHYHRGGLEGMIRYREALAHDLQFLPYDPTRYIELGLVHVKLGFSDIAAGNAHRALLLIEAALNPDTQFPDIRSHVHEFFRFKFSGYSALAVSDELSHIRRDAYRVLLSGLVGSAAFWDGLVVAREARKLYPDDIEIAELQADLKDGFLDRVEMFKESGLQSEAEKADLVQRSRTGKIYQKKYPWMDQDLYSRTPETMREVNKSFPSRDCEVKAVAFGGTEPRVAAEGEDVGPLGIFASRDFARDELILLDRSITGISDVPSSEQKHCDACHGSLMHPYLRQMPFRLACCNNKALFCSMACYRVATEGYHMALCGVDIDWVYQEPAAVGKVPGIGSRWKAVLFIRVVSIILADLRKSKSTQHPLQHPLVARMAANYPPQGKIPTICDNTHDWHYFENVIAPTKVLLQLGVDIFRDPAWTPEVIQTISWRMENNANMATTNLGGAESRMINLNTHYLFLNHSCDPNVSWHGATPNGDVHISWLRGHDGEILQPGCSAVWCTASRDVKKGEELKISYVGNPMGDEGDTTIEGGRRGKRAWLDKWFDNGCGCRACEEENREDEARDEEREVEKERLRVTRLFGKKKPEDPPIPIQC